MNSYLRADSESASYDSVARPSKMLSYLWILQKCLQQFTTLTCPVHFVLQWMKCSDVSFTSFYTPTQGRCSIAQEDLVLPMKRIHCLASAWFVKAMSAMKSIKLSAYLVRKTSLMGWLRKITLENLTLFFILKKWTYAQKYESKGPPILKKCYRKRKSVLAAKTPGHNVSLSKLPLLHDRYDVKLQPHGTLMSPPLALLYQAQRLSRHLPVINH